MTKKYRRRTQRQRVNAGLDLIGEVVKLIAEGVGNVIKWGKRTLTPRPPLPHGEGEKKSPDQD